MEHFKDYEEFQQWYFNNMKKGLIGIDDNILIKIENDMLVYFSPREVFISLTK
jgi:hypothetical protein